MNVRIYKVFLSFLLSIICVIYQYCQVSNSVSKVIPEFQSILNKSEYNSVKESIKDGFRKEIPIQLGININPVYRKNWWIFIIYFVLFLSVIILSIKLWLDKIKIKHQLKLEQVARKKEHELNKANFEFFTNIGYEFRTSLSLIIEPLESVILIVPGQIKEKLFIVFRNANRLLHLTNDLMDFIKLEEGITYLTIKYGNIKEYITETSKYFLADSQKRNIKFNIHKTQSEIFGYFDPSKLETILINLLSNAFKYVSEKGEIYIELYKSNNEEIRKKYPSIREEKISGNQFIEIYVTDNGAGINPKDQPYIFDKFYCAKTSQQNAYPGVGIGLALTKGLVELHRGFIQVTSISNQRTCFAVILPIDRRAYSDEEIISEKVSFESKNIINTLNFNHFYNKPKSYNKPGPEKEKPQILIAEDNSELRTFLNKELGKKYNVILAHDGKTAIDLTFTDIPDLIVSDIMMPKCSGIEMCKIIKSDIRSCHIPVILLTAKTSIREQIEGVENGADAYVTKPFSMELLISRINQLINSRQKLCAHFSQDVYIMPGKVSDNEIDQIFLQKVTDYIITNIADNSLNVVSLAEALNYSRSNMYRKIKSLTGKTIIEFIRMIRLKHAIKLMETKKYSLSEIAYLTGFTSPSYFTKTFRDEYGKPPSEFLSK